MQIDAKVYTYTAANISALFIALVYHVYREYLVSVQHQHSVIHTKRDESTNRIHAKRYIAYVYIFSTLSDYIFRIHNESWQQPTFRVYL